MIFENIFTKSYQFSQKVQKSSKSSITKKYDSLEVLQEYHHRDHCGARERFIFKGRFFVSLVSNYP